MSKLYQRGPYLLNADTIDTLVTQTLPGDYVLGDMLADATFVPKYVGRSDRDVNSSLKKHAASKQPYYCFQFAYSDTASGAFYGECLNYHWLSAVINAPLDNKAHPFSPASKNWLCPFCGQLISAMTRRQRYEW